MRKLINSYNRPGFALCQTLCQTLIHIIIFNISPSLMKYLSFLPNFPWWHWRHWSFWDPVGNHAIHLRGKQRQDSHFIAKSFSTHLLVDLLSVVNFTLNNHFYLYRNENVTISWKPISCWWYRNLTYKIHHLPSYDIYLKRYS